MGYFIKLAGLQFKANHGLLEKEKIEGNLFEVDIVIKSSKNVNSVNDNIKNTVDYSVAYQIIKDVMYGKRVKLIETLAAKIIDRLKDRLKEKMNIDEIEIWVRKYNPVGCENSKFAEVSIKEKIF